MFRRLQTPKIITDMLEPLAIAMTDRQRINFESKIDKSGDCHLWTSNRQNQGYGTVTLGRGNVLLAHRVSFLIHHGEIPDGMFVLHRCDVRNCVNPLHLWLGDHADNARDKEQKGRGNHATGLRNGKSTMPWRTARGDRSGARTHPEKIPRGELSGSSKLTESQVLEMREKYATGNYSFASLGKEYGISHTSAGFVVTRKTWRHI